MFKGGAERFGKADLLAVDLRQVQLAVDGDLKSDYRIVRVLERRAPLSTASGGFLRTSLS